MLVAGLCMGSLIAAGEALAETIEQKQAVYAFLEATASGTQTSAIN